MIIYSSTKKEFVDRVLEGDFHERLLMEMQGKAGGRVSTNEQLSWKNSLMYMNNVVNSDDVPDDSGVAIEYHIPRSNRRIDFLLSGKDENQNKVAIIVELKQWSEAQKTDKDAVVMTLLGKGIRETSHPSYQAWSYAMLLRDFNSSIEDGAIELMPCAYLHNFPNDISEDILDDFYADYLEKAPLFLRSDAGKLRSFIAQHVKHGDSQEIIYEIDSGKIRPSKSLADTLASLLKGNDEFVMIDDQKVVFENAVDLAKKSSPESKNVLIVEGGPGTGKSVVAVNLLVELTKQEMVTQYVTKNSAPRAVYESKLTGTFTKSHISNLFKGSGVFHSVEPNTFDALIVDEAHRLNEKSGLFSNKGENQIKEIINASNFSVFFVDEDQKVTLKDIGEKEEIRHWAKQGSATVTELELSSQFRCNGSDGYLAWLDNILQITPTANEDLSDIDFDFRVLSSASELRKLIEEKNKENNKARIVAGYCWNWISKKDPKAFDIVLDDGAFKAQWNLSTDGNLWILKPDSVKQVGCIHTCQGLEVDYIGVIIGDDFVIRNGKAVINPDKRARTDKSLHGYKKLLREDPAQAEFLADAIIKNTYRTLMSRGMKGCYVYSTDPETSTELNLFIRAS